MKTEAILVFLFLAVLAVNLGHWLFFRTTAFLSLPSGGWGRRAFAIWGVATGIAAGAALVHAISFFAFSLIATGFNVAGQVYSVAARRAQIARRASA